jgi:hypothetical protein
MEDDIHKTIKEEAADKETATEEEMMALRTHFLFALSNREEEEPVSRSCSFHFFYDIFNFIGTSHWQ